MKNFLVGVGIVAALGLSVFTLSKPTTVTSPVQRQGAITSPEISENHISVNGVTTWTLRQAMAVGTTSLCSFPNPAGAPTSTSATGISLPQPTGLATSSLLSVSVQVTTGSSTPAVTFDIASSTTPWATSTPSFALARTIPSGGLYTGFFSFGGEQSATSSDIRLTSSMAINNNIIGPAEIVNVKLATTTLYGGYTYGGQCIAVFRSLNAF